MRTSWTRIGSSLLVVAVCTLCAGADSLVPADTTRCCSGPCAAMVCGKEIIPPDGSMSRLADDAPLLFLGTVDTVQPSKCGPCIALATFTVTKAWKGLGLTSVTVSTGEPCAQPFPFAVGKQYLVAAQGDAMHAT